jgi:hypothetical protein
MRALFNDGLSEKSGLRLNQKLGVLRRQSDHARFAAPSRSTSYSSTWKGREEGMDRNGISRANHLDRAERIIDEYGEAKRMGAFTWSSLKVKSPHRSTPFVLQSRPGNMTSSVERFSITLFCVCMPPLLDTQDKRDRTSYNDVQRVKGAGEDMPVRLRGQDGDESRHTMSLFIHFRW